MLGQQVAMHHMKCFPPLPRLQSYRGATRSPRTLDIRQGRLETPLQVAYKQIYRIANQLLVIVKSYKLNIASLFGGHNLGEALKSLSPTHT